MTFFVLPKMLITSEAALRGLYVLNLYDKR